jgi:hypothetical protein
MLITPANKATTIFVVLFLLKSGYLFRLHAIILLVLLLITDAFKFFSAPYWH